MCGGMVLGNDGSITGWKRRQAMRGLVGSLTIYRLVAASLALWLCGTGPTRAGDGQDLGALQTYIDSICSSPLFGLSTCPQIPTIVQAVLEIAAFVDVAPEAVRSSPS